MSAYHPHVWEIIRITPIDKEPFYKVLAGWYGGYAGSDSWKISSGIEAVIDHGDHYELPQSSGSTYFCGKNNRRLSMQTASILANYQRQLAKIGTATIELINDDPTMLSLNSTI